MKKISEMTLEELQDYALALEEDKTTLTNEKATLSNENAELLSANKELQLRNNKLFARVEQTLNTEDKPGASEEQNKTLTCEEFAKTLIKGGK